MLNYKLLTIFFLFLIFDYKEKNVLDERLVSVLSQKIKNENLKLKEFAMKMIFVNLRKDSFFCKYEIKLLCLSKLIKFINEDLNSPNWKPFTSALFILKSFERHIKYDSYY